MALGQNTRSYDVRRCRPSSPLYYIDRVKKRQAWHTIIALGLHTRSDGFGNVNAIIALGYHKQSDVVRR